MSVLVALIPSDKEPEKKWLKIYNLDACEAENLEKFVSMLESDTSKIEKVNYVKNTGSKIKSIVVSLKTDADKIFPHIMARFMSITGQGFKRIMDGT